MGTKTIGITEDAYERLKARKRDEESFTELVERLLDEATADWRESFGSMDSEEMTDLARAVDSTRSRMADGMAKRQRDALEDFATVDDEDDETA